MAGSSKSDSDNQNQVVHIHYVHHIHHYPGVGQYPGVGVPPQAMGAYHADIMVAPGFYAPPAPPPQEHSEE